VLPQAAFNKREAEFYPIGKRLNLRIQDELAERRLKHADAAVS
jgi:hypothetical protein